MWIMVILGISDTPEKVQKFSIKIGLFIYIDSTVFYLFSSFGDDRTYVGHRRDGKLEKLIWDILVSWSSGLDHKVTQEPLNLRVTCDHTYHTSQCQISCWSNRPSSIDPPLSQVKYGFLEFFRKKEFLWRHQMTSLFVGFSKAS